MESLWPKLENVIRNLPIKILQEQADLFNNQMKGILECSVEKEEYRGGSILVSTKYDYEAIMYISSPMLTGYRLSLLEVYYSIAKAYPCEILDCINDNYLSKTANNPEEFNNILKEIFHNKAVVEALENIAAQSQQV